MLVEKKDKYQACLVGNSFIVMCTITAPGDPGHSPVNFAVELCNEEFLPPLIQLLLCIVDLLHHLHAKNIMNEPKGDDERQYLTKQNQDKQQVALFLNKQIREALFKTNSY